MKLKYFKKYWMWKKIFNRFLWVIFPPYYFIWRKNKNKKRNQSNRLRIRNTYKVNHGTWYKISKKLRTNKCCEDCNTLENLTVHHGDRLYVLCDTCHKLRHKE